jgi:hypothetical protein
VAAQALTYRRLARFARPAIVNGGAGIVAARGQLYAVLGFTVIRGRIAEIDILIDPERLRQIDTSAFI